MKKMTKLIAALGLSLATMSSFAQLKTGKITGSISTTSTKPLEAATISLLKAKDSSLVKAEVSDKMGNYMLQNIATGSYLIKVSMVAYQTYYSPLVSLTDLQNAIELPKITLTEASKELKNVVVTAKKQFIEQKIDRTIVNVDAVASNTGLNVLEILEKSPGVIVDKDGKVSLKGKSVQILIDGKLSNLGGEDLANMLRSMPSNQLEQLELMTNPPAKYDASGNGGIINLKTKKNNIKGQNGSVSLGMGQSIFTKANSSINYNYRNGKFNFFGNYSNNYNKNFQDIKLVRNFRDKNSLNLLSVFEQNNYNIRKGFFQSLKLGADIYMSKKTTLGIVFNGFLNPRTEAFDNQSSIFNSTKILDTKNIGINNINSEMKNGSININLRHEIDSTGKEITTDISYDRYDRYNNQLFNNNFYDKNGTKKMPEEQLKSNLPQDIKILLAKVDYIHPINKTSTIEAGLKTSVVNTDNDALYQNLVAGKWETDLGRTNHFIYKENINAAYINGRTDFNKKWSAQLGLRLENTVAKGNQVTNGSMFNRNYTQLFPTAFISYMPNQKNQFVINYGKRIRRPNYEDLNPFINFLDKYTYQIGNPLLNPEFTHNVELRHTFNNFFTTTINYSTTTNVMAEIVSQIDSTNTTIVKKSNIASQKNYGISINAGFAVAKWWRTNINTELSNNIYSGVINNLPTTVQGGTWEFNLSNQFTFKNGWSGDFGGFFTTGGVQGVLASKAMGTFNLGIGKQIMKKQGTIKIGIRDPLYIQKFHGYSKFQNIDIDFRAARDSRVVNLSFNYRFGKPIKGLKQRKNTGTADEQSRVSGG
jgi:iron complex outermembrane recepter protein